MIVLCRKVKDKSLNANLYLLVLNSRTSDG